MPCYFSPFSDRLLSNLKHCFGLINACKCRQSRLLIYSQAGLCYNMCVPMYVTVCMYLYIHLHCLSYVC